MRSRLAAMQVFLFRVLLDVLRLKRGIDIIIVLWYTCIIVKEVITMIKKLNSMPYAQAHVLIEGDTLALISYTTAVIIVDAEGWLICTGTYSQTTRKHIGRFMHEYGYGSYQLAKYLYEHKMKYNINTGEIVNR